MQLFRNLCISFACLIMLSSCESIKQKIGSAEESIQTSSLQFRRLMASLDVQRYVPGIPDMPVYRGFKPLGDENAVYDVVEGRIIDITYASEIADAQKVRDFYEIALNQLGWKPTQEKNTYKREQETLLLEVISSSQTTNLHILLQPYDK